MRYRSLSLVALALAGCSGTAPEDETSALRDVLAGEEARPDQLVELNRAFSRRAVRAGSYAELEAQAPGDEAWSPVVTVRAEGPTPLSVAPWLASGDIDSDGSFEPCHTAAAGAPPLSEADRSAIEARSPGSASSPARRVPDRFSSAFGARVRAELRERRRARHRALPGRAPRRDQRGSGRSRRAPRDRADLRPLPPRRARSARARHCRAESARARAATSRAASRLSAVHRTTMMTATATTASTATATTTTAARSRGGAGCPSREEGAWRAPRSGCCSPPACSCCGAKRGAAREAESARPRTAARARPLLLDAPDASAQPASATGRVEAGKRLLAKKDPAAARDRARGGAPRRRRTRGARAAFARL